MSILLYDGGVMTLFYFIFAGKAPSIWDDYFHTKQVQVANPYVNCKPTVVKRRYTSFHRGGDIFDKHQDHCMSIVNGDVACDSYNKVDEDVKNLVELGVRTRPSL